MLLLLLLTGAGALVTIATWPASTPPPTPRKFISGKRADRAIVRRARW